MLEQKDIEYLKKYLPFWDRLTEEEFDQLCKDTKAITYDRGESVHSPLNECIGVILVKQGELRTYILSEDGKEVTLYRMNEGDVCILSASCLLSNITFDVNIDAEKKTEILLISASFFAQLQNEHEFVENFALKITAERFSDVIWSIEQILFMKFDKRLAVFLLDESAKVKDNKLNITHEKIAQYMGSAREVVSRMLKFFEKEGLVSLSRGGIDIIDKDKLKGLAY